MARKVFDLHRREWSLRRNIEWSVPATGDDFEHDVDGGRGAAGLVLTALFVFWMILIIWKPADVHIPWFYWFVFFIILMFFPIRWILRRPWTVVAETVGGYDQPPERWTGLVRGESKSREEMRITKRQLETRGTPEHSDSPLQSVS